MLNTKPFLAHFSTDNIVIIKYNISIKDISFICSKIFSSNWLNAFLNADVDRILFLIASSDAISPIWSEAAFADSSTRDLSRIW